MRRAKSIQWALPLVLLTMLSCARRKLDQPRPAVAKSGSPRIGNCPVFPADNVWNTPIDSLPRNPRSDEYIKTMGLDSKLHPDFGSSPLSGIPLSPIPENTPAVTVGFLYHDASDLAPYPVPADPLIEGGKDSEVDRHILFIDQHHCILYELYNATFQSDGHWTADSGIQMDLNSNALRPDGLTSADAAGLPIFPGLVRYDEVAAGEIRHALRFTVPRTAPAHLWPARHDASLSTDPSLPPMGLRMRLRANFDISGYSRNNQVILRALQRYGMILSDNGSAIFVTGEPDSRWNDSDLHKLTHITGKEFEVVDESKWQISPNSAKVRTDIHTKN